MGQVILKNVTKKFGKLTAVDNLDLEIEDGELMVFVGPSGCGKSTTLRMVAGLEEITSGEIWIDGKLVNDVAPKDRDIAMVFQNYALYPHMSVYDNIAFGLKLRKVPTKEINQRVQKTAELLGITDKLQNRPKHLSGGQRQRVAVGRAIVRQPAVFLFDEPLSNLDAKLRVHMRAELQELHRELSTTTIYVTHDQIEAMTLGNRVAVLEGGILQQVDTPQRLYDYPANIFVAGFIGSPAMNFLHVKLEKRDGGLFAVGSGFSVSIPQEKADQLTDRTDQELVMGVRPEEFVSEERAEEVSDENRLTVSVRVVEPLGSEQLVYGEVGDDEVVAQLDPSLTIEPGQELGLVVNIQKIHFFDLDTEQTLLQIPERKPVQAA